MLLTRTTPEPASGSRLSPLNEAQPPRHGQLDITIADTPCRPTAGIVEGKPPCLVSLVVTVRIGAAAESLPGKPVRGTVAGP
jgi:hypothetical protein